MGNDGDLKLQSPFVHSSTKTTMVEDGRDRKGRPSSLFCSGPAPSSRLPTKNTPYQRGLIETNNRSLKIDFL
jgi:hypothetical protein